MRKREIVMVLMMSMLVLLIVSCCEGVNEYDYLQVVIQWQPATCSDQRKAYPCYRAPDNRFSIHGVWPSLDSGVPTQCSGSPFDITKISGAIQGKLREKWANVEKADNKWLWQREWNKHGTCAETNLFTHQEEYFTFGIQKYDQYDLLSILRNRSIKPDGKEYSRNQIQMEIKAKTGKKPAVRCNYNKDHSGENQLHEIALCFNKCGTASIDCPFNANKCPAKFKWFPLNTTPISLSKLDYNPQEHEQEDQEEEDQVVSSSREIAVSVI